ncbi:MAG: AAA family ATPase [Burkholderiales bacterium]|nr:AAA family ATPase [Burkholderiales bacterium]
MYAQFFGLKREPFSIAPDPRYLFMSERHREALAHLLYGVGGGGGFVLLTGEIGAGKTTVCRCFLEQIPRRCNVAYIFNPKLTVPELLKSVCDEFRIPHQHQGPGVETVKDYLDPLNEFLLKTHAVGQNNVLIIDEAQNLSADVLEQLRLLTNLETSERKLLQIILIGQPELRTMLARPELEQLAQRVIARFHLDALSEAETAQYIQHRLTVAGLKTAIPFDRQALRRIHQLTLGVPRRINLLCDRALLGAYANGQSKVSAAIIDKAAAEVFDQSRLPALPAVARARGPAWAWGAMGGAALAGLAAWAVVVGLGGRSGHFPAAVLQGANGHPAKAVASAAGPLAAPVAAPLARDRSSLGPASAPALTAAELVARFKSPIHHERDAWRELAPWWQVTAGDGDPCLAAAQQQVLCFKSNGGLALIRQLDRPAILMLHDPNEQAVYVLLTGLTSQSATLRMGGVSQTIALGALVKMWRGEFATFWRPPPGYVNKVLSGHTGPAVGWLAAQLATLHGEPAPIGKPTFDAALHSKVLAFQLAQGLKPDGVAGAVTFMQLNRAVGVAEPHLNTEPPAR